MTEYTSSPAAIEQYRSSRSRTADWVSRHPNDPTFFVSPSVPPSLIDDSDDGMSTPSDSDISSHSLPPRMMLKYPDGRPDIPISESAGYSDETRTSSRDRRKEVDGWPGSFPYAGNLMAPPHSSHPLHHTSIRSHATAYPHSSLPPIASHSSSSTMLMVPPPHQTSHYPAPETIQIHPSHPNPYSPYTPVDPHPEGSGSQRSRSMHSSRSKRSATNHPPPQMIYTPPNPPPNLSNPVSPARSQFSQHQQPREIVSPSPVYAYANKPELTETDRIPQPDPASTPMPAPLDTARGQTSHSGSHSNSHGPPPAPSHHSHSLSKSSSGSGGRANKPPSIVYAPSKHSSDSYNYNPPVITTHPPPSAVPMQRTPSQHPSSHYRQPLQPSSHHTTRSHPQSHSRSQPPPTKRIPTSRPIVPSYSDPTHDRGDRSVHDSSKNYNTYDHGRQPSDRQTYAQYGRAPSPEERGGRRGYDDRQRDSHSSGSTYYVITS